MVSDLYPFQGRYLDLPGGRLHYLDEGKGDPLVMLHGNPTWSFYFRNLILALRDGYRVIAPDHMGCGRSDKPDDARYEYTLRRRVDDVEALLEHLGVRSRVTLILHDWGGMIGMAWAQRHPERVARLVITNTAAFHLPRGKAFPWALRLARAGGLGEWLVRRFNLFATTAARVCVKRKPLSDEVRRMLLSPYDSYANRIATIRFVQDIPLAPGDKAYEIVSAVERNLTRFADRPMLVCWGERDFVFSVAFLEEWIRRFPHAEVHRFGDCGHYVLEDAGEEITGLVRRFLEAHPLPAEGRP